MRMYTQTVISSSGRAKKNKWRGSEAYNQLDGLLQAPGGTRPAFIAARGVHAAREKRPASVCSTHMRVRPTPQPKLVHCSWRQLNQPAALREVISRLITPRARPRKMLTLCTPGVGVAPLWACKVSEFSVMGSKRIKKLIRCVYRGMNA